MTSFMTKKKKYKFQVEICLEELLEVPFVSAVLFAKLRLNEGGFQDHSSRQEVKDHKVQWDAKFSFPCKMMAIASTGVMEKCLLRISIRKESKGGRSFNKLGFVDLNLAEYAGAGLIHKKALLEGYDARHRQDNSMLKFRINLNMIAGDPLFKTPSPPKTESRPDDFARPEEFARTDEFAGDSLAGSIKSGSSGFGSLPKKNTPLPAELGMGQPLSESGLATVVTPFDQPNCDLAPPPAYADQPSEYAGSGHAQEPGHSRNSSNTSQMSKASGYSSISHSRQSSSGDSTAGHIRNTLQHDSLRRPPSKFLRTYTFPKQRLNIPTTILSESPRNDFSSPDVYHTPQGSIGSPDSAPISNGQPEAFYTPLCDCGTPRKYPDTPTNLRTQNSNQSNNSNDTDEIFKTPDVSMTTNVFDKNFNALQKSASSSVVEIIRTDLPVQGRLSLAKDNNQGDVTDLNDVPVRRKISYFEKNAQNTCNNNYITKPPVEGIIRSKSDFIIPKLSPTLPPRERTFSNIFAFLTPHLSRKEIGAQSTPIKDGRGLVPPLSLPLSNKEPRAVSMGNLKIDNNGHLAVPGPIRRLHRKMLLDGSSATKLAPMAPCSSPPDDQVEDDGAPLCETQRRPSSSLNPSSGSLATSSETGSLDRAKAAYERRKKNPSSADDAGGGGAPGRVEGTRVNPEDCIEELLQWANLKQLDESAETSGLQLYIAKDGTASLGNHEVKSQMSTFKQVVMDDR